MRTKLLRGKEDVTVQLVYPSTVDEYRQALDVLGRPVDADSPLADGEAAHAAYVVTTAQQRDLWDLPDLAVSGRAAPVDDARALDLLHDAAANPEMAAAVFPGSSPEAVAASHVVAPSASCCDALRDLFSPGERLDQVLGALDRAAVPAAVRDTLSEGLTDALHPGANVAEGQVKRIRMVFDLPWAKSEPQRFDRDHVMQVLQGTHGALDGVKADILRFLASCPQACGLLTFEGPCSCGSVEADGLPALVVRSGSVSGTPSVLCLVGARGSGKTSLAQAIARALGRTAVTLPLLGQGLRSFIHGQRRVWPGRVVQGLIEAKVQNPVFVLEGIDKIAEDIDKLEDGDVHKDYRERVESMLAVLDPSHRTAFQDAFLQFPLDLSGVLWIATATDPAVIPAELRDCLHVVDLPVYTEQEKVAIAEEHLLRRPFDGVLAEAAGVLAPDLGSSGALAPPVDSPAAPAGPVVVADRVVSCAEELRAFPPRSPVQEDVASDSWRTAAVRGDVCFEPDAIRRVIRDYTSEPGVRDMERSLAEICRQVVLRRPPAVQGPDVVTSSLVPMFLGDADVDPLPLAVRQAIEDERRRLSVDSSSDSSSPTSSWIEWLENVPWSKRNDAAIDLDRIREILDARQAGLEDAKATVVEYLAVRKRNPRGTGAVLCFLGPPGVGKTSLAQSIAQAMGRKYARVPCGGVHDASDLRGHNRTWHKSQPGSIIRELRRVGYRDPVLLLDEVDKIGPAPAAVLLEVLDPEQQNRFRDSFLELPFDLSEVIFIATANDWDRIPPPLRDRLEVVELSAYTEREKLAIARTHLVPAENRAAGLMPTPVGITDGALRQLIREHTNEPGIRQLSRCVRTVCRKVALGRETGDRALDRKRVTARDVRRWLGGADGGDAEDLDALRRRLDDAGIPSEVQTKGREFFDRLSGSGLTSTDLEYIRSREYLERLAHLPWNRHTAAKADLVGLRAKLDAEHVGLNDVKEHIIDHVAVRVTNPDLPTPVLCLKGPQGVGKTSLAYSLSSALGRVCARVDCGDLVDAEGLVGDPRGGPGRILKELQRVGARNPLILFDELDELRDRSDLQSAFLELFDPVQRACFRDRYLDVPFDLSEAFLVTTAVSLRSVPSMLRDRLKVIAMSGYTAEEKGVIALEHLLPIAMRLNGLVPDQVEVTDAAVRSLIRDYARDTGLWFLVGALDLLCRKVARRRAGGELSKVVITPGTFAETLGPPTMVDVDVAERMRLPGVAIAMGWTSYGGDVLFAEAGRMPGSGKLTVTGSVGDSMRESVMAALSWVRANADRYGADPVVFRETDIHIHVQSAAEMKDGPSAGVALVAALVSSFTGRPVRGDLAMTGEITLSGHVLPVAAITEKVQGACRRGLSHVVLPRLNRKHFESDVPESVRGRVTVHYVQRIDDLMELVLRPAEPVGDRQLESSPRVRR